MICVPRSGLEKSQLNRSKAIDRALTKDKQVLKNQVQLLLLGRPQAGKTTLVKQLRVRSGDTFSQEELETSKMAVLENLTTGMKLLLSARQELEHGIPWMDSRLKDEAAFLYHQPLPILVNELGWEGLTILLARLWREEGVQTAWAWSALTPGMDCLPRFLEDPHRLCDQKYIPSTTDIMFVYQTTHGVFDCAVKGEAAFRLVEIGGQSLTTPKLLYYFDNVTAVIFMASCCDVEPKIEDGISEFQETCEFFSLVTTDKSLQKLPIILLITKLDVLMEKTHRMDLRTVFPAFRGDSREVKDVQKYVLEVFRGLCGPRPFYHHFIKCTDLHSVQQVFVEMKRDIRDSLLRKLLPQ